MHILLLEAHLAHAASPRECLGWLRGPRRLMILDTAFMAHGREGEGREAAREAGGDLGYMASMMWGPQKK